MAALPATAARLERDVKLTYVVVQLTTHFEAAAMASKRSKTLRAEPTRARRLGFRLDRETKDLIEHAAHLERRKLTDFCVTALAGAARKTIAEHETLMLSERDRQAFFDALIDPPKPSERLVRAIAEHKRRIAR